jgi:hypothetical protein
MSTSSNFWQRVFQDGSFLFDVAPRENPAKDRDTMLLLARFYQQHTLAIAGPSLKFVEDVAAHAARVVEWSAWYLVSQSGTLEDLDRDLAFPDEPRGPAEYLSADLTLQYLPSIYQRARALFPADRLTALLGDLLLRWPLSGVLADLPDAAPGNLEFGGHPGLLLCYAERLAENFKPAWMPRGLGVAYVEMVWTEMGRDPALLAPARRAN